MDIAAGAVPVDLMEQLESHASDDPSWPEKRAGKLIHDSI
jgi:hypothetical protein